MPDVIPMQMTAAFWRGKAQRAQRSGDLPEAIRLYRAALRVQESSGVRRELAQVYADAHCFSASERLYLENLAADAEDTDSLYGLARTRSMAGDRQEMADLLDLYLRISPCGEQADHARDILWDMRWHLPVTNHKKVGNYSVDSNGCLHFHGKQPKTNGD